MDAKTTLTRTDWITAAFRALTTGGPQAIRAEAIARDLKVSKGSFYWHFKDVPALNTAMISHWQQMATDAVISDLDAEGQPAPERLRKLMATATSSANEAYGGRQAEAAIRDWGRYDKAVQNAVQDVDQRRMGYVAALFQDCGFTPGLAEQNARLLYAGLVGIAHLRASESKDLGTLLEILLASPKD